MEDQLVTDVGGSRYSGHFQHLLAAEGLGDPLVFREVEIFDETPVYSRYEQLEFLGGLTIAERNRELILAAVRHLVYVEAQLHARGPGAQNILRMVSVTDWWVDGDRGGGVCTGGTSEILTPHIWIGNLEDDRMREFRVFRAQSPPASFVREVVGSAFEVFDSRLTVENAGCPDRVYVAPVGRVPGSIQADQTENFGID